MRKAELAFAFMLVLLTVGCDRVTKHLASVHLADQPARSYLADTIRLEYAENTGAFLSLGSGLSEPIRFGLFRLGVGLALLAIVIVALKRKWHGLLLAGVTLLFAGGISNLIDRLNHGTVVDFASVGIGTLRTGIFNVADVAILAGGLLMVVGSSSLKERT